jgi:ATPase subunit of ABC transporter with duplicated ATPase domains
MLAVKKISKNYGSAVILSEVSFTLGKGEKAALVGPNGVGKTTLLRILAGLEDLDSGNLEFQKSARIGYLAQDTSVMGSSTVSEYIKEVSGIQKLEEHKVQAIMAGFGFRESDLKRSLASLSSGQKMKVALVGILLKDADLLLLDEPTNNLDLPSLIWLEDFLKISEATAIVVSHDRRFLDRVTRKIIEVDNNTRNATVTGGKYSDYLEMSVKRIERARESYRLQQEEITRLTEEARKKKIEAEQGSKWQGSDNDKFLRGFKRDRAGKSSKKAKTIEKRIEMMDKIDRPIEKEPLEISLNASNNPGTLHISLRDMVVGYEGVFSVGPISVDIIFGNRVGIMGLNGSGKSTLLRTITGTLKPLKGTIEIGSGVRIGNMMQEHETLPRDNTPLEFLESKAGFSLQDSYAKLAKFGIDPHQAKRPIGEMSPGGRARLILSLFSALSVNTLVLDEPTNHLDIEAVQALEETLDSYTGTVILVSHDRYFLEKSKLDSVYQISDGRFARIGDYSEYIEAMEKRAIRILKNL